jgi:hypothetical protein
VRVSIRAVALVEVISGASGAAEPEENGMSVTTTTAPTVTEPYAFRRASSLRRTTVVVGLVAARRRPDHAKETVTMPQYLLSVWFDEPYDDDDLDFSAPETERQMARTGELTAEMERAGAWVFLAGLRSASSATVVRAKGEDISMTDGPYAETKEQMAGFWVIEAPDLDAALEWAAKASIACERPIEVRPTHA